MEEELVFQLLEEERKARTRRIAEEKKITTEDCLVIGILRLNGEIEGLYKRIDDVGKSLGGRMDRLEGRMDKLDERMGSNFKWLISMFFAMFAMIITMWVTIIMTIKG